MKILMTGATGLIGKELGKKLVAQGHELSVLTRNATHTKNILPFPAKIIEWKNYSEPLSPTHFNGIDSVIHLAGESIASGRWSSKRKKLILDSRVIGTRNLVNAIKTSNLSVKQFISASAIGIYGNGDEWVTEDASHGDDFLSEVCQKWEEEASKLIDNGINVVNPRIGIVLSRNGGAMDKMLPVFSLGLGGAIGNGKQWMSWIHIDDLTNLFIHLINNQNIQGPVNAVAPGPVTNKDFSKSLAKSLGRGLFFPVPGLALKIALGEMSTLVTGGQRVSSQKIEKLGFNFKYTDIDSALLELCSPLHKGQKEFLSEVWLPKDRHEVFRFFCNENNLERLTPPSFQFRVLKKSTEKIQQDTLITYSLNLYGLSKKWTSLIEVWEPEEKFVDRQIKGPYALWYHTHEFVELAGGTLIRDRVIYKVPLGRIGEILTGQFIKKNITDIFRYRGKVISDIFN